MGKLLSILRLTRIEHSLLLIVAVIAAELISSSMLPPLPLLLLSLVPPVFISMASFAINDYFDIEVDRKNRKMRPLVDGSLEPIEAVYITVVGLAIGIIAGALINQLCFIISVAFGLLAVLYSYKLKEIFFIGNAYIALSMAIPFIFGNYVVSNVLQPSIPVIVMMIFFAGLAREIHGTLRDFEGDTTVRRARSVPKVFGERNAARLSLAFYCLAIAASLYLTTFPPFSFSHVYLLLIFVADFMFLWIGVGHMTGPKRMIKIGFLQYGGHGFYEKARSASLWAIGIALLALLLAPLV